ncbi:unnamed protein product [Jaminaea pallidilutea]
MLFFGVRELQQTITGSICGGLTANTSRSRGGSKEQRDEAQQTRRNTKTFPPQIDGACDFWKKKALPGQQRACESIDSPQWQSQSQSPPYRTGVSVYAQVQIQVRGSEPTTAG